MYHIVVNEVDPAVTYIGNVQNLSVNIGKHQGCSHSVIFRLLLRHLPYVLIHIIYCVLEVSEHSISAGDLVQRVILYIILKGVQSSLAGNLS